MASSSSSLYRAVLGILSKTTGISLFLAASLAKRSANSLSILLILYEGVEDDTGEYRLRVNEMIVFSKISVDIKFLCCVKMCSFFLWQCAISIISFMGPNKCASSIRCLAKLEVLLLLRHAVLCSL